MSTYLVTGGAGFLGAHTVREVLANPALGATKVVVLDDLSGGTCENLPHDERLLFVEGSITDSALVGDLFRTHRFRFVYHLAAYAAEGLSHFIRRFNYTNNVVGSVTLINAAVEYGCECFVFTSSIAVYGSNQVPMLESMLPRPEDPYGIAKLAVELDLEAADRMFGLRYIIFRPHNVYGEFQNLADPYRNVIGIFMKRLLQGEAMPIFGDGEQQRAFTYVGDIAPIIAQSPLVPRAAGGIYNLGADRPWSVNEVARQVAASLAMPARVEHLPARNEVVLAYSDHSRCREVFGDRPETPLENGLQRMAAWAKTVTISEPPQRVSIEVRIGLPQTWSTDT